MTLIGASVAHIGFSAFIGKAYPFFGYIGLFEIVAILIFFLSGKRKKN